MRQQRERAQAAGLGSRTEQAARAVGRKRAAHARACKHGERMRIQDPAASLIVMLRPFGARLHRDLVGAALRPKLQRSPRSEELVSQLCRECPRLAVSNIAEAKYLARRRQTLANGIVDLAAMVHFPCHSFAASWCSWLLRMISDDSAITYHLFDETPRQTRATANNRLRQKQKAKSDPVVWKFYQAELGISVVVRCKDGRYTLIQMRLTTPLTVSDHGTAEVAKETL